MIREVEENSINIEAILADVRRKIKERGYTNDVPSFYDGIYTNEKKWDIPVYYPIRGNPLIVIIKKMIRKITHFLIEPIVTNQNMINSSLNGEIEKLKEKITDLENKLR
jgi:hypothetical protein